MAQMHRPVIRDRKLLLFKWAMVFVPALTVTVGHFLLLPERAESHGGAGPIAQVAVTVVAFAVSYVFVEALFKVLRALQAEAVAREQDVLTMGAVMQERERLSRELHDGVAQLVADLLVRLDTIKDLVAGDRRSDAEAELERLHGVASEIYEDIGESITGLRSNVTERGLILALQDYVDRFEERHQIPVSLRADDSADRLPPLAALQVFRLVQEALTNVRKHSGAREVTVSLTPTGQYRLKVVIADDGQGFVPGAETSGRGQTLGLTTMRERVEALRGSFEVKSWPGAGTQVTATIPLPHTTSEEGHAAIAASAR